MLRIFLAAVVLAEFTASAGAADSMTAGLWDITVTMENIDGPGVSADMRKSFAAQKPRTLQQCLTADELKPSPEKLARESGGKCRATSFTMANGKLASATSCSGQGSVVISTSSGTYGPKNYSFRSVSTIKSPKGDIRTTVLTSGKWLSACAAK
jgi:hypothetical protein